MAEEYTLVRDIIHDHSARMMNIKKYYPYFKLAESDFSGFRGGRFAELDMGYILMAVLRFFIEENSFKEKDVDYGEYEAFMRALYRRDFDLVLTHEEEQSLSSYIFDKIRNDGKPFSYQYFDPDEKVKKTIRMRIIDSRIRNDAISYYITSDAIEFYLDTKEIKDESTISIAQVLLGKLIETRNFRGGTEVIRRINSEVNRLKLKKNDVLAILSHDVFEGAKAYEDFVNTGIRWFDEEQKLFEKNMELIREAMSRTEQGNANGSESSAADVSAMRDIYELETELKKAIVKHSELLNACTELQLMADELINSAKYSRLRRCFDFGDAMRTVMDEDRAGLLKTLIEPMLRLNIRKSFDMISVDRLLTLPSQREEQGEPVTAAAEEESYTYEDEIEAQRIEDNFDIIIICLFDYLIQRGSFRISEFNAHMEERFGQDILKSGDYYSLLVHMCQKREYSVAEIAERPDTFFEEYAAHALESKGTADYDGLCFELKYDADGGEEENEINILDVARITNIELRRK